MRRSSRIILPPLSDTGATASTNWERSNSFSPYSSRIRGRFRISHQSTSPLNHSIRLIISTSLRKPAILFSKVRSKPEMRVPINVTERTPMIIPNAVRIDRDLLEKIEPREIRKFSQKSPIMKKHFFFYSFYDPLLFYHQKDESFDLHGRQYILHGSLK